MATRWETYPIEFKGGLVTNLSRLQQGIKMPGSARELVNFEPSIKGGYRRINGYTKFSDNFVPRFGESSVQGSGQSGTNLVLGNVFVAPTAGDSFTVSGVSGTYTIATVSYSSTNKEATLTLTASLDSSPADKAAVTFSNSTGTIEGLSFSKVGGVAYAIRDGAIWESNGTTSWSRINTPAYGTTLVKGGSQTGTTLIIDGISDDDYKPQAGDTFTVVGVEKTYSVVSTGSSVAGTCTLTIAPALDSSPSDNAAVTFLSDNLSQTSKARFVEFNFSGTFKLAITNSATFPAIYDGTTYVRLLNSDLSGSTFVAEYKDHLFFSKGDLITFSAPFDETDYTPANGSGSFRMSGDATGLIVFRENLISFTENEIKTLIGNSSSDFTLETITRDIGCLHGDTIQEVGGDVIFLGPDGLRFLGATQRIGDFSLALASRNIQDKILAILNGSGSISATVVREKNQYRLFEFVAGRTDSRSDGYLGVQFTDQDSQGFSWAKTEGIKAYRTASTLYNNEEYILFSGEDGYVYRMESGSTFDGTAIPARLFSPYISITDPSVRKTGYKVATFFDPEGTFAGSLTLNYDFNSPTKIQPAAVDISAGGSFSFYGAATYGTSTYGGRAETVVEHQVTGSFSTVSFQYEFNEAAAPFILDTVLLEYKNNDRK